MVIWDDAILAQIVILHLVCVMTQMNLRLLKWEDSTSLDLGNKSYIDHHQMTQNFTF